MRLSRAWWLTIGSVFLCLTRCGTVPPPPFVVTSSVVDSGSGLEVSWSAVAGAAGYHVYLDGETTATTDTKIDVTSPTRLIGVAPYRGTDEGDVSWISTELVVTPSLTVSGMADTLNNEKSFGFNSSGTAFPIDTSSRKSWSIIDYVVENRAPNPMSLCSPDTCQPVFNNMHNSGVASSLEFDSLQIAPRAGYARQFPIAAPGVYSLWLDPTADGWSTDDHFAKVKVEAIAGNDVTLKLGFQRIGGLRWLISP